MDVGALNSTLVKSSSLSNSNATAGASSLASNATVTAAASVSEAASSAEQVAQAVSRANDTFAARGQSLHGSIDKDKISGVYVYKIVDTETMKVVRQLPPKEVVAFAQSLEQPQGLRGLLVQETS